MRAHSTYFYINIFILHFYFSQSKQFQNHDFKLLIHWNKKWNDIKFNNYIKEKNKIAIDSNNVHDDIKLISQIQCNINSNNSTALNVKNYLIYNKELLIRVLMLLFYSTLGSVMPYMPVYYRKQLGLTGTKHSS